MLIWDYIRDFLVQNIFGGCDSNGDYHLVSIGMNHLSSSGSDYTTPQYTTGLCFPIGNVFDEDIGYGQSYISMGDWLSTTTTIIIMCLIVVLFAMLVRWVFKTVVSAFLLR